VILALQVIRVGVAVVILGGVGAAAALLIAAGAVEAWRELRTRRRA
jgi:hypothetical protein